MDGIGWSSDLQCLSFADQRSLLWSAMVTGLTSPNYSDGTVAAGQTYFYEVTAVNASGESARSSEIQVVIPNP